MNFINALILAVSLMAFSRPAAAMEQASPSSAHKSLQIASLLELYSATGESLYSIVQGKKESSLTPLDFMPVVHFFIQNFTAIIEQAIQKAQYYDCPQNKGNIEEYIAAIRAPKNSLWKDLCLYLHGYFTKNQPANSVFCAKILWRYLLKNSSEIAGSLTKCPLIHNALYCDIIYIFTACDYEQLLLQAPVNSLTEKDEATQKSPRLKRKHEYTQDSNPPFKISIRKLEIGNFKKGGPIVRILEFLRQQNGIFAHVTLEELKKQSQTLKETFSNYELELLKRITECPLDQANLIFSQINSLTEKQTNALFGALEHKNKSDRIEALKKFCSSLETSKEIQ